VSAGRFVSQRTPHPGDLIGWFRIDGQSNATNFDTQCAGIKGAIGSAGPAPVGILRLETASGTGNKGSVPAMFCSKGCWLASTDGLGNSDIADPGWGNLATHSLTAQNAIVAGGTKINGAYVDGSYRICSRAQGSASRSRIMCSVWCSTPQNHSPPARLPCLPRRSTARS
jgi:hypothetical protein